MFITSQADLAACTWRSHNLGEALETLAEKAGYLREKIELPSPPASIAQADEGQLGQWINTSCLRLNLEAEAVETTYAEVDTFVRGIGPALLHLPAQTAESDPGFLAILKSRSSWITIVGPDLKRHFVQVSVIRSSLCLPLENPLRPSIEQFLTSANVAEENRAKATEAILNEQLSTTPIGGCWLLRLRPGASMFKTLRHANFLTPFLTMLGARGMTQMLLILSWWIVGMGALQGHFEWTWLITWALLLFTVIPFELLINWGQSLMAIRSGSIFKKRLLFGTLRLNPEEIRHQGIGQFLSRVMESEAVEMLALNGGFSVLLALIEMATAIAILSQGTESFLPAAFLIIYSAITALIGWRYFSQSRLWLHSYRRMTNDLVERMVGHRTRLAQEDPAHWHDEEDQYLAHYLQLSEKVDSIEALLKFVPRGWLIIGLTSIAYTFIIAPDNIAMLAVTLGGVLLGNQALGSLIGGMASTSNLLQAWDEVGPIFNAASRPHDIPTRDAEFITTAADTSSTTQAVILEGRDISFQFQVHAQPVLRGCNFQINQGDRILLEGPSGGGKSTLASILTGMRQANSGLLLLKGFDNHTVGLDEWRRRVVSAPQFHENHVLTETFAFNLLMGRQWPARPEDLEEAESLCRELGLGDLLEKMPAGFQQMVGESGWQLSHGERSRLYIARTLLQKADLIILDESFAALDPENLQRALKCVLRRAPTLVVIAHP